MISVYLENALHVSSYNCVFRFQGGTLEDLIEEVKDYLSVPAGRNVRCEVYNRRLGSFKRALMKTLPHDCEEVYVMLKVEDDQYGPTVDK
jgi:hypothetical protein